MGLRCTGGCGPVVSNLCIVAVISVTCYSESCGCWSHQLQLTVHVESQFFGLNVYSQVITSSLGPMCVILGFIQL